MRLATYYNEHDPRMADWLVELIKKGHLPEGEVDERDIEDVCPEDLREFTACHFFAGIGGWAYALQLAGWPADRQVWTGSCPCQPFSSAGKGKGHNDDRHLWPYWGALIAQCRPPVVFGEQVEAAIRHGWLDTVFGDLEAEGYACGASVLGAHSVGAPHIRQRVWFVAESESQQHGGRGAGERRRLKPTDSGYPGCGCWDRNAFHRTVGMYADERCVNTGRMADGGHAGLQGSDSRYLRREGRGDEGGDIASDSRVGRMANPPSLGATGHAREEDRAGQPRRVELGRGGGMEQPPQQQMGLPRRAWESGIASSWDACDWLPCRDGKYRPVEPGTFPLAHGVPARVGRLRGYGNAIVPQVAAEVIAAYMEIAGIPQC